LNVDGAVSENFDFELVINESLFFLEKAGFWHIN